MWCTGGIILTTEQTHSDKILSHRLFLQHKSPTELHRIRPVYQAWRGRQPTALEEHNINLTFLFSVLYLTENIHRWNPLCILVSMYGDQGFCLYELHEKMDTNLILVQDKAVQIRRPSCWRSQDYQWEVLDSCRWVLKFNESAEETQLSVNITLLVKWWSNSLKLGTHWILLTDRRLQRYWVFYFWNLPWRRNQDVTPKRLLPFTRYTIS